MNSSLAYFSAPFTIPETIAFNGSPNDSRRWSVTRTRSCTRLGCSRGLVWLYKASIPVFPVTSFPVTCAKVSGIPHRTLSKFAPVAHVEAGIRTGDPWDPWPEENFRVGIDRISEAHFYATGANFDNVRCGMPDTFAHVTGELVTGNTGIDALYSHTRPLEHPNRVQDRVLVTLHRRESFGDPLKAIVSGIVKGAEKYAKLEFMWPAHPNPKVQEALPTKRPQNLWMIQPMATTSFAAAKLVVAM